MNFREFFVKFCLKLLVLRELSFVLNLLFFIEKFHQEIKSKTNDCRK
jgi:hypothetical protein